MSSNNSSSNNSSSSSNKQTFVAGIRIERKKSLRALRDSNDAFADNLDRMESEERQRSFRDAISKLKPMESESLATSNSSSAQSLENVDHDSSSMSIGSGSNPKVTALDKDDKNDKNVLRAEQLSSARRVLNYRDEKCAIVYVLQQQESNDRRSLSRIINNNNTTTTSSFRAEKDAIIAALQPPNADTRVAALPPPYTARSDSLRHEKVPLARENSDKAVPGAYRAGGRPVGARYQRPNTTSARVVLAQEPEPEEVPSRDLDLEELTSDIPTEHLEEKPFWSQPRWILVIVGVLLLLVGTGAGLGIGLSGRSSVVPSAECTLPQSIFDDCLNTGVMNTPLPDCALDNYWALRETFVPSVLSDFSQHESSCAPINLSLLSMSTQLEMSATAMLNRLVLGAFYYNGGDWSAISWFTNPDPCEWTGIICNTNGEITSINLSSTRLQKQIPTELGLLPYLEVIDLSRNLLTGEIPSQLGSISNLETLLLMGNFLTGSIPSELGAATQLKYIGLSTNNMGSTIPSEIGQLLLLTGLDVIGNKLSGTIPSEIGACTLLTRLDLSVNQFIGAPPPSMGNLANLEVFSVRDNMLAITSIPDFIFQLKNLEILDFSNLEMSGPLPASQLGILTNLRHLTLSYNSYTGTIPTELGLLSNLESLYADGNFLTGSIPTEIGLLTRLSALGLMANNGIRGEIPSELGLVTMLMEFNVGGTSLSGTVPVEVGNMFATNRRNSKYYVVINYCASAGEMNHKCVTPYV